MKGGDCKVPIQEDHKTFLHKPMVHNYTGNKKFAFVAALLLLIAMTLMIVFTFQSISGISELRKEVDHLKTSLKLLQKKINETRDDMDVKTTPYPKKSTSPEDYYYNLPDDYSDYGSYNLDDDYETEEEPLSIPLNISSDTLSLTGEEYTKDAKKATVPPRTKRSIVGFSSKERRKNNIYKDRLPYATTGSPLSSESASPPPRQIYSRRLHVYQGDEDSQNFEENPYVETTIEDQPTFSRPHIRRLELDERHIRTGRMRPLPSAHYSGDTSKYVYGQHENYNGNGHLRHPRKTFVDWAEDSWVRELGMDHHFSLNNGFVTIKEAGLYFVYAQIYYYDAHDTNGFRVSRNENETLLQCTTMTHSVDSVMKGNTCFTASAAYLNENDRISLGDISDDRYSLFEPGKSFFGMIKIGDVKIK